MPSMVTAKYIDMFRGEHHTVYQPPTLDDHNPKSIGVDMAKAFLNPSEEDALLWARWGGAGFDMGSFRQAVTNPYKKGIKLGDGAYMSWVDFLKLIEPSLPKDYDDEDIEALLRRTGIIVITETEIVFRVASREKDPVPAIPWQKDEEVDIFVPEVKEIMQAYKNGCRELPATYDADVVWSQEYLKRCMAGTVIPRSRTVSMRQPDGSRKEWAEHAQLLPPQELAAKVKKEKFDNVFKNIKKQGPMSIDLDLSDDEPEAMNENEQAAEDVDEAMHLEAMNENEQAAEDDDEAMHLAAIEAELETMRELGINNDMDTA